MSQSTDILKHCQAVLVVSHSHVQRHSELIHKYDTDSHMLYNMALNFKVSGTSEIFLRHGQP